MTKRLWIISWLIYGVLGVALALLAAGVFR